MGSIDRYGYLAARVMLAAIFLLTGYDKLVDVEDAAGDIAEVGLPLPALLAVTAGLVELVCGAFLALGRKTEWAAAGLLLFLVWQTGWQMWGCGVRAGVKAAPVDTASETATA